MDDGIRGQGMHGGVFFKKGLGGRRAKGATEFPVQTKTRGPAGLWLVCLYPSFQGKVGPCGTQEVFWRIFQENFTELILEAISQKVITRVKGLLVGVVRAFLEGYGLTGYGKFP